ncbi:MarR family winged helix-turn-helix transcriptional regulator [Streptomyces sp. NPDC020965]|uniref:MarR family winged helix-turn-helix transcriptional regulator n=1 Tax=Streptomyces sp. NPDC020965 TaxID=3365105 RepID=UPI0037907E74
MASDGDRDIEIATWVGGATETDREGLASALDAELRALVSRTVLFHQAVADRLRMSVLDLSCLGALVRRGAMSAGELAGENGVTTGAITGVVDRLEAGGYVRRAKDPLDRRRVVVTLLPQAEDRIGPLFEGLTRSLGRLCEKYGEDELRTVVEFLRAAAPVTREETLRLRAAGRTGA